MATATLLQPYGGGLSCDDPDKNIFDIHGGGIDLLFPHHENEIAQSCCALGTPRMANIWMHNGFLQVEGEKMSKSLGNFITIHELLTTKKFGGRSWRGETLRLAMMRTHYRQPIDWTVQGLEEAEKILNRWYDAIGDVEATSNLSEVVIDALADDLNAHAALTELHRLAQAAIAGQRSAAVELKSSANLLGLLGQTKSQRDAVAASASSLDRSRVADIVAQRIIARENKNWPESDRLRNILTEMGVAIKDNKDGTTSWDILQ